MLFLVKIGFPLFDDECFFFEQQQVKLPLSLSCFFFALLTQEEKSNTTKERVSSYRGKFFSIIRERESLRRDVRNDVEDKNDGRQTKCVYLLFRFFFFLGFLLLSLFQKRESIYLVVGDVFDSSRTSL